tara:strand:+ start:299 stop:613 length:315 start_codon:yes stop_codon:yes gene_type:complete
MFATLDEENTVTSFRVFTDSQAISISIRLADVWLSVFIVSSWSFLFLKYIPLSALSDVENALLYSSEPSPAALASSKVFFLHPYSCSRGSSDTFQQLWIIYILI